MLVSVIVLTYKNLELLQRNLLSIVSQDYSEIELIIQDDGTDGFDENEIRQKVIFNQSNIVNVIISTNQSNLGTVKNYNKAIELANGEIIIPLSCDDIFYDDMVISQIVKTFQETNCQVCTAYRKGNISGKEYPEANDVSLLKENNREKLLERLFISNFISGACLYWKKDFLKLFNGFDERYILLEDYPIVLKLVELNVKIGFLEKTTIIYNETGVSNRWDALLRKNNIIAKDAKLVKDMYVIPNLNMLESKRARRLIKACYYIKFSESTKQLFLNFIKYIDIWWLVLMVYLREKKMGVAFGVHHILENNR